MKTQQMKARLILKGHNSGELSKFSDEKISLMYQKEVLKLSPEIIKAIIGIKKMCGSVSTLRSALFSSSSADKLNAMSEEELQRMVIEKQGLDTIIEASRIMKQEGLDEGLSHNYENTLSAMRKERGKEIVESEEYKSLDEKGEKREFLEKLSIYELEDAESYYTNSKNAQKMVESVVRAI